LRSLPPDGNLARRNETGAALRILVFQHVDVEHPAIFRDFLAADGIAWDAVELDAGAPIPALDGYDQLWVMGGPMDVWEEDLHPWLVAEKITIREAVAHRRMPYLGVCLGHQLLGAALGGDVGKAPQAEVGVLDVELTAAGRRDPLFDGMADRFKTLQWHGAEVRTPPPGATVLARSPLCAVQAMRVGSRAYGMQYHCELLPETVGDWAVIPAYACALEASWGAGAMPKLQAAAAQSMPDFNRDARRLYENFMRIARE
jgi:GMP synthase-like glutamine amidotransferase